MELMTCMVAMLMMRGQRVVREREVVIDEVRVMGRHHNKLSREDSRDRRRRRRRHYYYYYYYGGSNFTVMRH